MRRSLRVLTNLVLVLAVPLLAGIAGAQEPPAAGTWQLSLDEALRTALEHNLDLTIVKKDPKIASFNVEFEAGAFDPALTADALHQESKAEPSSLSQSSRFRQTSVTAGWADRLKFGATYTLGFSSSYTDSTGGFTTYNPAYDSGITGTLTLPLLRGFGVEQNTVFLILAENSLNISREDLRRQAHVTIQATEDAYWDVAALRRAAGVARESLKLAQDLFDLNKKKVDVGTLAPIEITQAEAGVASREEGVIVADTALANAEDILRQLMAIPKDDPAWAKQIVPTTAPTSEPRVPDLESSLATALQQRPEMASARKDLESKEVSERVTKKDLRPQLDFVARVSPTGNNLKDTIPITIDPDGIPGNGDEFPASQPVLGNLGTSISEIPDFRNYGWSAELLFSYPIGNRQRKASYAISTLNREKSEVALENTEQSIRVDVRAAVRAVESGVKRIAAAHSNTVLQRKTVEAEQKKLENGMSTSFEVLRIQTDLSDAQVAEIRAVLDYNKALADLERAKGTLLEARGLTLEEPTDSTGNTQ